MPNASGVPMDEDIKKVLREVFKELGYIVIATAPWSPKQYKVGEIINHVYQFSVKHPWQVTTITDAKDWMAQTELIAKLRPEWPRTLPQNMEGMFYRITPAKSTPEQATT